MIYLVDKRNHITNIVGLGEVLDIELYNEWVKFSKYFNYNPMTGLIVNRVKRGRANAGQESGGVKVYDSIRYRVIVFECKHYYAHSIAWFLYKGYWPRGVIDHINHNGLDNRIDNLREVTHKDNLRNAKKSKNNTTGYTGVYKQGDKYCAKIGTSTGRKYLGLFDTAEEASQAYELEKLVQGYNVRHGG